MGLYDLTIINLIRCGFLYDITVINLALFGFVWFSNNWFCKVWIVWFNKAGRCHPVPWVTNATLVSLDQETKTAQLSCIQGHKFHYGRSSLSVACKSDGTWDYIHVAPCGGNDWPKHYMIIMSVINVIVYADVGLMQV